MRILFAYNQHRGGGGADNATRATIEAARRAGCEVEVFTRNSADLPGNLRGRLTAGTSAIFPPPAVREFDQLLDAFQPDVVHAHEVFPLVSPWILPRCSRKGIPVVMTTVDYRLTCPVGTHLREGRVCDECTGGREHRVVVNDCRDSLAESITVALYNRIVRGFGLFIRHVDHFVAPSEFTRDWMIRHGGIDPSAISAISPVVQIPAAAADPAAGEYVAYASRFSPEKGMDTLFAAARLSGLPFKLSRNEASLVMVDVPGDVDVVVTRDRAGLDAFYRGARMLVFPSIWFETFGLVGAEAMSHGIPVVASRIGALASLVRDGVDGLLFEPNDPADLARKVRTLWDDPALLRRLGAAARERAVATWGPQHHFEQHRRIYDQLLARRLADEQPQAAAAD